MSRVHGLEHVHDLGPAGLADDDSIRPHSQTVFHQVGQGNLTFSFNVRGSGLQAYHVGLVKAKFGAVFDGDDPFRVRDKA